MPLPETIRVKLSSEAAESISLTRVVVQEIALPELVGHILAITGKDQARVREILLRGSLVSGGSRFRWAGWEADVEAVRVLLGTFPDPDPTRIFAGERCVLATLRGGRGPIAISRAAGSQKGIFRRTSFWDVLMKIAAADPDYAGYSYRDRADRFMRELTAEDITRLREASPLLRYSTLRNHVRLESFHSVELIVER